jgi:hypothetical protein
MQCLQFAGITTHHVAQHCDQLAMVVFGITLQPGDPEVGTGFRFDIAAFREQEQHFQMRQGWGVGRMPLCLAKGIPGPDVVTLVAINRCLPLPAA